MVCSAYAEFAAAVDRAFAGPPRRPLPIAEIFAELAAAAEPAPPEPAPPPAPKMEPIP